MQDAQRNLQSAGIWGIVILLVVWSVGYCCGGYLAGRMARFDGAKQGVTVWAWAVVIAIVALARALLGGLAGMRFHRRVDRAGFDVAEPR